MTAAGELEDVLLGLSRHTGEEPDPDRILAMQRLKTAHYTVGAPLRAGALLAGADPDLARAMGEAGADLAAAFRSPTAIGPEAKTTHHDLVTVHDRHTEARLVAALTTAVPGSGVLGEELGAQAGTGEAARLTWIVDPIDGTSNFTHGFAMFSVSLAAEVDGEVAGSVVLTPPGSPLAETSGDGEYEFRMLAVHPRFHRRGVGGALLAEIVARARAEEGVDAVVLTTMPSMTDAHRMYERAGFVRVPERDWLLADVVPDLDPADETGPFLVYRLALD